MKYSIYIPIWINTFILITLKTTHLLKAMFICFKWFFFFLQYKFVSFDLCLDRKCRTKNWSQSGGDVVFEVIHGYHAHFHPPSSRRSVLLSYHHRSSEFGLRVTAGHSRSTTKICDKKGGRILIETLQLLNFTWSSNNPSQALHLKTSKIWFLTIHWCVIRRSRSENIQGFIFQITPKENVMLLVTIQNA